MAQNVIKLRRIFDFIFSDCGIITLRNYVTQED